MQFEKLSASAYIAVVIGILVLAGLQWRQEQRMASLTAAVALLADQAEMDGRENPIGTEPAVDVRSASDPEVRFSQDGVSMSFNWMDVDIEPGFDLHIGPAVVLAFSPDKKFLYVGTGQGGGIASFIYDPQRKSVVYFIPEAHDLGTWLPDGRWEVTNHENFGETPDAILSVFRSWNAKLPWDVMRVK